ncbi:MAG: orotate phosphoribosyltransferase, partial [Acidimicrobiales bacterium]|nr:orotate phosphoribosyltransferase [Acidimicrobiales bacterium]
MTDAVTDKGELGRRVYDAAHLTGTFTLRSGVVSNEYFDKYRFEADPALLADLAAALVPL